MSWRCGVCDGVNQGGETCGICGASRAAAVPVDPPVVRPAPPPPPTRVPGTTPPFGTDRPRVPDAIPSAEPARPRGLIQRAVDAAFRGLDRIMAPSPPAPEPPPEPEAPESRSRRRPRMKVRPFPFGVVVTWEDEPDEDAR